MMVGNDIIIRNGWLVDGTGAKGFISDIAVKNGKITEIEEEIRGPAERIIDASGKIVSPGFIDIQTHCDSEIFNNDDTRQALNLSAPGCHSCYWRKLRPVDYGGLGFFQANY